MNLGTGKEIRFRFGSSEDKADTASRTCLLAGRAAASQNLSDDSQEWRIIYLQVLRRLVNPSAHGFFISKNNPNNTSSTSFHKIQVNFSHLVSPYKVAAG